MGVRDLWNRTLVYFGLAEDESFYDDEDDVSRDHESNLERSYRERPNVRRIDRSRGRSRETFDDIFSEEPEVVRRPRPRSGSLSAVDRDDVSAGTTTVLRAGAPQPEVTTAVRVHVIAPRSFNDAQQIADRFKVAVPVILNLQSAEPELAKRLIDFGSGLTYALDGGMQRIAEKVFLLTPRNVEVSAEERARLIDKGFFNQS